MKYLLDTNALIGFLYKPDFLSVAAKNILENEDSLYVSIVSLWEIGIKQSIGKIDIITKSSEIAKTCEEYNIALIPILPSEIDDMKTLPPIHKDPFDRLLVSQARMNAMTLITKDTVFPQYPDVLTVW